VNLVAILPIVLLEARDGLALWKIEVIDLEALSEEAILLQIEVPT